MMTETAMQTPSKGQLWKSLNGDTTVRVLCVRIGSTGRSQSVVSMLDAEYVRYFNLRTRRQSEARIDTFRSSFPVFSGMETTS